MRRADELRQLAALADLAAKQGLAGLSRCRAECQASLDALASLVRTGPDPNATPTDHLILQRHGLWLDQRRAEINIRLAQQTVALADAEMTARHVWGRAQAIKGLLRK